MIPVNDDAAHARLRTALIESAIKLGEGIKSSGEAQSWLLDCRALILQQPFLHYMSRLLWSKIAQYDPQLVAGSTLSADPLIVGILNEAFASGTSLGGLIIRREPKRYGTAKLIEGPELCHGQRVIVVDDLVNTGKTIERVIALLETRGAVVAAVAVLVDFQTVEARHIFERRRIPLESLFTLTELGLAPSLPNQRNQVRCLWTAPSKITRGILPALGHDGRSYYAIDTLGGGIASIDDSGTMEMINDRQDTVAKIVGACVREGSLSYDEAIRTLQSLPPAACQSAPDIASLSRTERRSVISDPRLAADDDEKAVGFAMDEIISITHDADNLYAVSKNGEFICAKREGGSCIWKRRLLPHSKGTPLFINDIAVLLMSDSFIAGFDRQDGKLRWISKLSSGAISGPCLVAGYLMVLTLISGFVALIDGRDGQLVWRYFAGEAACSAMPNRNEFVVATTDGSVLGFGVS